MHKKRTLYFFFCLFSVIVAAQAPGQVRKWQDNPAQKPLRADGTVTAIVLRTIVYAGDQLLVSLDGRQVVVPYDPDAPDFSYFLSLPKPMSSPEVLAEVSATIYLINSGTAPELAAGAGRTLQEECEFELNPIMQSEWREGLPAPSYTRSFTDVKHVVVHHSAGSNTSTNYTQVVRDIYLYHTQGNGWSDVGYNYLIAQNGALYAGRDPAEGSQDDVLGAHFCGSNSATMGVCLLGNYEAAQPASDMWVALQQVVAFKLDKEALTPMGSEPHPLGNIGHVAGHRDGCSTRCPGENVYSRLSGLRSEVEVLMENCDASLSFDATRLTITAGESITFINTSQGYDSYLWLFEGGVPESATWQDQGKVTYAYPGIFDVALLGISQDIRDTLSQQGVIRVMADPKIFPNPASALGELTIASEIEPEEVLITGLEGITYFEDMSPEDVIQLPALRQGVYLVRMKISGDWVTEKLLIL